MINQKIKLVLLSLASLFLVTACLPKPVDVNQTTYMLSAKYPTPMKHQSPASLQINDTTIAAPYADNQFVYRMSDLKFTKDFYNLFFIPPNEQIHSILLNAFQESKGFADIERPGSLISSHYLLKSHITELYADYSNRKQPQGVLTIEIALYHETPTGLVAAFQKTYHQTTIIQTRNSHGLVLAWNEDLTQMLPKILNDVHSAISKTKAMHQQTS